MEGGSKLSVIELSENTNGKFSTTPLFVGFWRRFDNSLVANSALCHSTKHFDKFHHSLSNASSSNIGQDFANGFSDFSDNVLHLRNYLDDLDAHRLLSSLCKMFCLITNENEHLT